MVKHTGKFGKTNLILLTGGLGYLGSLIAIDLLAKGETVRIATSRKNATLPDALNQCELFVIDFFDLQNLKRATNGAYLIIHLAGMNAFDSNRNPVEASRINGLGTRNLLKSAQFCGVNRFIYFSTIHVYGTPLKGSLTEETATQPISQYAITNRMAEDYVLNINGLDTVILRLSNIFGIPYDKKSEAWKLVVNDFCKQSIVNKVIDIKSSGQQKRNFLSINELLINMSLFTAPQIKITRKIFNVGGVTISIIDLAELISEICNQLFGYKPVIKTGVSEERYMDFDFECYRLKNLGGSSLNFHDEIKRVLIYCHENFINEI